MNQSPSDSAPFGAFMYVIHHVFLPPRLPLEDDFDPQHEGILLDCISDALERFKAISGHDEELVVQTVLPMIENLISVRDVAGTISESKLQSVLRQLHDNGTALPMV